MWLLGWAVLVLLAAPTVTGEAPLRENPALAGAENPLPVNGTSNDELVQWKGWECDRPYLVIASMDDNSMHAHM